MAELADAAFAIGLSAREVTRLAGALVEDEGVQPDASDLDRVEEAIAGLSEALEMLLVSVKLELGQMHSCPGCGVLTDEPEADDWVWFADETGELVVYCDSCAEGRSDG